MEVTLIRVFLLSQFIIQALCELTCDDKKQILDLFNDFRTAVANGSVRNQPKASDMQVLVWDAGLEKMAQNETDRVVHAQLFKTKIWPNETDTQVQLQTEKSHFILESLKPHDEPNWYKIMKSWFDQHHKFVFMYTYYHLDSDYYKTMVTSSIKYVGCGYSTTEVPEVRRVFTCTFKPVTEMYRYIPYETGPGCEHLCCEEQCSGRYIDNCP